MSIDLSNVATKVSDVITGVYQELSALPVPEIVNTATPQQLANLTAEEGVKFVPYIYKSIFEADMQIAANGKAIQDCALEIGRVEGHAMFGVVLGAAAIGFGCYTLGKISAQQRQIDDIRSKLNGKDD